MTSPLALLVVVLAASPPPEGSAAPSPVVSADPLAFWSTPRAGANCFNEVVREEWFREARAAGIDLVRLVPDKWKGAGRDFLLGDADRYQGIPPADLARLRSVLDDAHKAGVRVVLGMLSLPGHRWKQNNADVDDGRLWIDVAYHDQAARFWADLARALDHHPAVVGFNFLNEPHPDAFADARTGGPRRRPGETFAAFGERVRGSPADVNVLFRRITKSVRAVDATTPIVLDGIDYASPAALNALLPTGDERTLYSVHMYEPWDYTTWRQNQGKLRYPGVVHGEKVDRAWLERYLAQVATWQAKHGIGRSRMIVGELGVDRRAPGAERYLEDLFAIVEGHGWHYAFYSFREDTWPGFDYEVGPGDVGAAYWQAKEKGGYIEPKRRKNALWDVVTAALARRRGGS